MKLMYGNTPVKSLNIHTYEKDTNDATLVSSDLQAGVTAYARGQKVTGTGKCFEFAQYGTAYTNFPTPVGDVINVIEISSTVYPVVMKNKLVDINNMDFSTIQEIGTVTVDGVGYLISAVVENNILTISCDKSISLEVFYGKDNYV